MKIKGLFRLFFLFAVAAAGCAPVYVYEARPPADSVEKPDFRIVFELRRAPENNFYDSFILTLENRTEEEMKIDWENTFYLLNGKPQGRFGWQGMTAEELKSIKELPLVSISPGEAFSKEIFPLKLVGYQTLHYYDPNSSTFSRGFLPQGKNGIRLTLMIDRRKIEETMTVEIAKMEK